MNEKTKKVSFIDLHVIIFILNIVLYYFLKSKENPLSTIVILLIMIHIFLCVYIYIMKNQKIFLLNYSSVAKFPKERIRKKNKKYLTIFLGFAAMTWAILSLILNEKVLGKIKHLIRQILHNFFSLFFENAGMKADKTIPQYNKQLVNMTNNDLFKDQSYLIYLQIFLIIIGIFLIIKVLRVSFGDANLTNKDSKSGDVIIKESNDIYSKASGKSSNKLGFFARNTDEKIRKRYIKLVKKSNRKNKKIRQSLTPSEIEQLVGLDKIDDIETINYIYQKARYSKEECTDEDYKILKDRLR